MSHKYFVFTNLPATDVHITISHDSGWSGIAMPATDPQGRAGSVIDVPDSVPPNNGAQLNLDADGKLPLQMRGVLVYPDTTRAYLQCDDFILTDLPTAPEPPPIQPPSSASTPLEVINAVYATGVYNLATKTGCGEFTEECCRQLASLWGTPPWGHIAKSQGQNQFNAHAVDAVHSLYGPDHGIWDIITSSVSSSARPAFNRAGDAKPELWRPPTPLPCVPAGTATRGVALNIRLTLEDLIRFLAVGRVI
jgi:hypothetical protein